MVWQAIRGVVMRIEASLVGYWECRGEFRIADGDGCPLAGVRVEYRVGDSGWIPCGHSKGELRGLKNFSQPSTVFCRIGDPVVWRFCKSGYAERTVTRYTADMEFDSDLDSVELLRCGSGSIVPATPVSGNVQIA